MVIDTRKTPKEQLSRIESDAAYEYRLLRLEFIKAAMAGYAANSAEWIKNASTPDTAKLAIQLADCTLAAAGEKGA